MKNKFLAKSNGETIYDHTKKLLENLEILLKNYPNINVDKKLLYLACIYHDLGKINLKFQNKLFGKKSKSEIPHGILSTAFINDDTLIDKYLIKEEEIKALENAVAFHHDRNIDEIDKEMFEKEIKEMNNEVNKFEEILDELEKNFEKYLKNIGEYNIDEEFSEESIFWKNENGVELQEPSHKYFSLGNKIYSKGEKISKEKTLEIFEKYVMLKGLLNKIDYAASSYTIIEEKNDFLEESMNSFLENNLKKDNPKNDWNELQKFMINNKKENVVIVAQTGYGKTEAGLLWIGNKKGFFTLPLRVAINSIYKRIKNNIVTENIEKKVGLLHSDFREIYTENNEKIEQNEDLLEYMDKTKQFSLPLTICTIDQLFDFVFRGSGFELKVATLSYSKVVIDEIQMYSSELLSYLIYGLKYITNFGGKFAIMTATLPGIIPHLLEKEGVQYITPTAPFINEKKRHSIKVINNGINADFIKEKYINNKILVVCNTVKKAKQIYEELKKLIVDSSEINLIHSKFIKKDRAKKEKEISKFADPKRYQKEIKEKRIKEKYIENGIWIGTQVLEASLDLDFDILITELSDLNGLFQRMGRCYRNRELKNDEYNSYVFIDDCSGLKGSKHIIDKEIHIKSKKELLNIDGLLTEKNKLNLIDKVYSYESLKETDYFKKVVVNINYLNDHIIEHTKNKKEVQEIFRNIASYDIIPKSIYEENKKEIEECIEVLKKDMKGFSAKEKKDFQIEKIKARSIINQYKVSIPDYEYEELKKSIVNKIEKIEINKYEEIILATCEYSHETGVEIFKENRNFEEDNVF